MKTRVCRIHRLHCEECPQKYMEKVLEKQMSVPESREREKNKKAYRFRPTENVKS